jgi:putative hemolysin
MTQSSPKFRVKLAQTEDELRAAQRLRYDVFVTELGGSGDLVDHEAGLERDAFDPYFDHLILYDDALIGDTGPTAVGVYRLLPHEGAARLGRYYSEDEYNLTPLRQTGRRLLELGRSCLHPNYRGGSAMYVLWQALANYVNKHDVQVLFGVASFHGTNIDEIAPSLSMLYHRHLAPVDLRVHAKSHAAQSMNLIAEADLDRKAAMLAMPALIKAYLRLGGVVGADAFVDHRFNTTDVCLIMDTAKMNEKQRNLYARSEHI